MFNKLSKFATAYKRASLNIAGQYTNSLLEDMAVRVAMNSIFNLRTQGVPDNPMETMRSMVEANRSWNYLSSFLIPGAGRFCHFAALVCRREMRHYGGKDDKMINPMNNRISDYCYQAGGKIGKLHDAAIAYEKAQLKQPNERGTFRGSAYAKYVPYFRLCYEGLGQENFSSGFGGPMWANFAAICGEICELLTRWEQATLEGYGTGSAPVEATQIQMGPKWQHNVPEGFSLPEGMKADKAKKENQDIFFGFADKAQMIAHEISAKMNIADGMCHNNSPHLWKMLGAEITEGQKLGASQGASGGGSGSDPYDDFYEEEDTFSGLPGIKQHTSLYGPKPQKGISSLSEDARIRLSASILNAKELENLIDQLYVISPIIQRIPDLFSYEFWKIAMDWKQRAAFANARGENIPLVPDVSRIAKEYAIIGKEKKAVFKFTKAYAKGAPQVRSQIDSCKSISDLNDAVFSLDNFDVNLRSAFGERVSRPKYNNPKDVTNFIPEVKNMIFEEAQKYPGNDVQVKGPVSMYLSVSPEGKVVEGEEVFRERIEDPYETYEEEVTPATITISSQPIWDFVMAQKKLALIGILNSMEGIKMEAKQRAREKALGKAASA